MRSSEVEALLDGAIEDDSIVSAVVGIIQRGWNHALQLEVAELRKRKGAQLQDYSRDHFDSFSHGIEEVVSMRPYIHSLKQRITELNDVIQFAGSEVLDSRKQLDKLHQTQRNLKLASERVAASLAVVSLVKRAKSQMSVGSFVPALRTVRNLRVAITKARVDTQPIAQRSVQLLATRTQGSEVVDSASNLQSDTTSFMEFLSNMVPVIERDIEQQVKKQLIGWFTQAAVRAIPTGRSALDWAAQELMDRSDIGNHQQHKTKKSLQRQVSSILGSRANQRLRSADRKESILKNAASEGFNFGPVLQFVYVNEYLNSSQQAIQYYTENRLKHLSSITSSRITEMSGEEFALQFREMLESVVAFFLIEEELLGSVRLFKRTELRTHWVTTITQLSPTILDHVGNSSAPEWQQNPLKLLEVIDTLVLSCQVFQSPTSTSGNARRQHHIIDSSPLLNLCQNGKYVFVDSIATVVEHYVSLLVSDGWFFIPHDFTNTNQNKETNRGTNNKGNKEGLIDTQHVQLIAEIAQQIAEIVSEDNPSSPPLSRAIPVVMSLALAAGRTCFLLSSVVGVAITLTGQEDYTSTHGNQTGVGNSELRYASATDASGYVLSVCASGLQRALGHPNDEADHSVELMCAVIHNANLMKMVCEMVRIAIQEQFSVMSGSDEVDDEDRNQVSLSNDKHASSPLKTARKPKDEIVVAQTKFESVASQAQDMILASVRRKLGDLLAAADMVDWNPSTPPAAAECHEFLSVAIGYLEVALSPNGTIFKSLEVPGRHALLFLACRLMSNCILDVLTKPNSPPVLNSYSLKIISSDVDAIEAFANQFEVDGLRDSVQALRQLTQVLAEDRIRLMFDPKAAAELYPLVSKDALIAVLTKVRDVNQGMVLFSASSRGHVPGSLSQKTAQEILKKLHNVDS